jgi:CheY-like chemotaxis protein
VSSSDGESVIALMSSCREMLTWGPILLVEDDADIRDLLSGLLEYRGYSVLCAASGEEALELLRSASVRPVLILLDLMMPTMDGYAFRAAQRRIPGQADVPVVVTSATPNPRMNELEPAELVMKPLEFDDLLPVIERYCQAAMKQ